MFPRHAGHFQSLLRRGAACGQVVLENNIEYDAGLAAQELAKAPRSEVVQVIGTKFVLYRESHSKPKEKRIALVKDKKKKTV